jgi:hypothetical protein
MPKQLIQTFEYKSWKVKIYQLGDRAFQYYWTDPNGIERSGIGTWFTEEYAVDMAKKYIDQRIQDSESIKD